MRAALLALVAAGVWGCAAGGEVSAGDEAMLHKKLAAPPNGRNRHGAGAAHAATDSSGAASAGVTTAGG